MARFRVSTARGYRVIRNRAGAIGAISKLELVRFAPPSPLNMTRNTMRNWLVFVGAGTLLLPAIGATAGSAAPGGSAAPVEPAAVRQAPAEASDSAEASRTVIRRYCVACHNGRTLTAGLALDDVDMTRVGDHAELWEMVVRKLRAGLMPPAGRPRPDEATYDRVATWLETELDAAAAASPNPGRTQTFHRLNRAEYRNAVRDVLGIAVDVEELLPADSASYGFDNIAGVLRVSESLMERYLTAARRIGRAAVGTTPPTAVARTYTVSPALPQDDHVEGLPYGTRGGTLITHRFPLDAEYVLRVEVSRVSGGAQLEVTVDGERVELFRMLEGLPSLDIDGNEVGDNLEVRLPVAAGPREIGVAFLKTPALLSETPRRLFLNPTVSRRELPYLRSLTVTGPFDAAGPGDTPARQRLFVCRPAEAGEEAACADTILATLARRAWRRPVDDADLEILRIAYAAGREGGGFEAGIERALQQLLVSPEFLFRVEADPADAPAAAVNYRIADLELASRLSFFLWSSVPDDELLDAAAGDTLSDPAELGRQVRRMLADERARALTDNFVGQWLQLRNLEAARPSQVLFADFDDGLRQAFRRETELFFESIVREDRSVLDLLDADYTFVNDRLARHYGIPHVQGSHFRRVAVSGHRGGLLGQGSVLTITSHPVRTSPVFRGRWILTNILGTPPPDPPPNVPALPDRAGAYADRTPSMRERMAAHRDNPACASCHAMIDPLGFGLERFDPVGRLRDVDEQHLPIDASGVLPDGTAFDDVPGLRSALLARPDRFVGTLTEKLLTYALGRGLEPYDMPTVRAIVRRAADEDYRLSAVVLGIVESLPFRERRTAAADAPLAAAR